MLRLFRSVPGVALLLGVVTLMSGWLPAAEAANPEQVIGRWEKEQEFVGPDHIQELDITATYMSGEYIQALVQKEAEKHLWTEDEMESYKYELFQTLRLEETIPLRIQFKVRGSSLHLAPFKRQLALWIDNTKLKPIEVDGRFNFPIDDSQEGYVYFPRNNPETGESYLEGAKRAKLVLNKNIHSTTMGKTVDFLWDIHRDDPTKLFEGKAARQLETDRLLKRLEKLNKKKKELEQELKGIYDEIYQIEQRLDELQKGS
ncbi:MAG: hypothetical protein K9L28_01310 [Synergistales bacterium]|nr:hypothetical protein [Synergistales bacterium]